MRTVALRCGAFAGVAVVAATGEPGNVDRGRRLWSWSLPPATEGDSDCNALYVAFDSTATRVVSAKIDACT